HRRKGPPLYLTSAEAHQGGGSARRDMDLCIYRRNESVHHACGTHVFAVSGRVIVEEACSRTQHSGMYSFSLPCHRSVPDQLVEFSIFIPGTWRDTHLL